MTEQDALRSSFEGKNKKLQELHFRGRQGLPSLLLFFSLSLLLLCACAPNRAEKQGIRIGISVYDQYDSFISCYSKALEAAAQRARSEGTELVLHIENAAGNQITQNEQVQSMLEKGCDVIAVNLVDRTAPSEIIDMARKAGVPVIFFNRELVEEDLHQWNQLYYVGAEARQSGELQGQEAAEDILADFRESGGGNDSSCDKNHDGRIQYVMLEGEAGHQDAVVRSETSVQTLKQNGVQLDKLGYAIANWSRSEAKAKMSQLISQNSGIELVLCNNDDMALGAVDAYNALSLPREEYPLIYGVDGTAQGLSAVESGDLAGTVYNDEIRQSQALLSLALRLAKGESLSGLPLQEDKYIRIPYQRVRRENVEEFRREREERKSSFQTP